MSKLTPGLLAKRAKKALRKEGKFPPGTPQSTMDAQAVNHHDPERQPKPSAMCLWLNSLPTE